VVIDHHDCLHERVADGRADELEAPLSQNGQPAEAGLRPFEDEKLEQPVVVMNGCAPFPVMISISSSSLFVQAQRFID